MNVILSITDDLYTQNKTTTTGIPTGYLTFTHRLTYAIIGEEVSLPSCLKAGFFDATGTAHTMMLYVILNTLKNALARQKCVSFILVKHSCFFYHNKLTHLLTGRDHSLRNRHPRQLQSY